MSLFADYHKELGLKHVIESESGFCTYYFVGKECYIEDIYVVPEQRRSKYASTLADLVVNRAKDHGCTVLTGSAIPQANNFKTSQKMLLAYGFKFLRETPTVQYYFKEI